MEGCVPHEAVGCRCAAPHVDAHAAHCSEGGDIDGPRPRVRLLHPFRIAGHLTPALVGLEGNPVAQHLPGDFPVAIAANPGAQARPSDGSCGEEVCAQPTDR